MESELFGHTGQAFTGAKQARAGLFEAADGGTLFLDEISEMPLATQVKLLRFLETGTFRRVGGVRALKASVRVVAATNRPLSEWIADGRFRQDLYFRLAVCTIEIPPLRARREDIGPLAEHFVRHSSSRLGRHMARIDAEAVEALSAYDWPGNVRELRNAIESACILSDGRTVRARDLPSHVARARSGAMGAGREAGLDTGERERILTLAELERRHIERVLSAMGGHRDRTAKALGIATKTLYRKLREYGMN
jgi:Nif-specific regulatory protein